MEKKKITENVSACRFSPTDHGSICNSNILKYRVTTFRLDTLELIAFSSYLFIL